MLFIVAVIAGLLLIGVLLAICDTFIDLLISLVTGR